MDVGEDCDPLPSALAEKRNLWNATEGATNEYAIYFTDETNEFYLLNTARAMKCYNAWLHVEGDCSED